MKKVYGFTVDDETRCTHYQRKKTLSLSNSSAAINTTHATNAMQKRKITSRYYGKGRNTMKKLCYAVSVVRSIRLMNICTRIAA